MEYEFPNNSWAGTSANSDKDDEKASTIKSVKANVRYLSIEPLLGDITFDLSGIQWLIIGAQTGKNPVAPKIEWIENILQQADNLNIPVFMKKNIEPYYDKTLLQQFPL